MTDLATTLLDALDRGRRIPLPSRNDPGFDLERAWDTAAEIHARRVRRGERPVGRKIGFSHRGIWAAYGVDAPIWGWVYDTTLVHAPSAAARFSLGALCQPRLEPEIQLHFARTPPLTRDEEAILACVDWIAHGFEIVQCPYADWNFTAPDSIAAGALHGALVVGPPVAVSGIVDCAEKLRRFTLELSGDGELRAQGRGSNALDSPLLAFAHLAEVLSRQRRAAPVEAGEIVTTGTLTPPPPVAAGQTYRTRLEGIELPGMTIELG